MAIDILLRETKFFIRLILALLLLYYCQEGSAQSLPQHSHFIQYSDKDGLSSNTVYDIIQNQNGEIILGTSDGISVFNGLGFRNFSYRGKGRALQNFQMIEKDSSVLASSFFGDIVTFRKDSIFNNFSQESNVANNVLFLINDIPCTQTAFEIRSLYADTILLSFKEPLQNIIQVKKMDDQSFWLISRRNGVYIEKYDSNFKLLRQIKPDFKLGNAQFLDINNQLLLYDLVENHLYNLENNKLELHDFQLDPESSQTKWLGINSYYDSIIVLNGFDGVLIFNSKGQKKQTLFKGLSISKCFLDMEGNFWFTSLQDGVFMVPSLDLIDIDLRKLLGEKDKVFRSISGPNGTIILGTHGGKVIKLDAKGNLISSLQLDRKAEVQAMTFSEDSSSIWVFCDGLFEIDNHKFKVLNYNNQFSTKAIEIVNGNMYSATSRGFYTRGKTDKTFIPDVWVNTLIKWNQNIILGTVDGIYLYNISEESIKRWGNEKSASTIVLSLQKFQDRLYMQTLNEGILELIDDKIQSTSIGNISLKDAENMRISGGHLFCTMDGAIYEFDISSNRLFCVYDKSSGIESALPKGIFRFGEELVFVFPNKIQKSARQLTVQNIKPWVSIRDIEGNFKDPEHFILPFEANVIEILVDVHPNIKSRGQTRLYYKFNETKDSWKIAEALGSGYRFRFQNLSPDSYDLQFKAKDINGVESEICTIHFSVSSPFWQTSIFIISLLVFILLATFIIYRRRVAILKRRTEKYINEEKLKARLLLAELTAIRSQMNPHFIFNVMSAIQSDILKGESRKAFDALNRFSKLMRTVLEKSSREYSNLEEEIDVLRLYLELEKSRFDDDFEYRITIDPNLDTEETQIPTLITQPFVENSIKHGLLHKRGNKQLDINIQGANSDFKIEIRDNGIGRKRSTEINEKNNKANSFATEAIKSRIDRINQQGIMTTELNIKDLEEGTVVELKIKKNVR